MTRHLNLQVHGPLLAVLAATFFLRLPSLIEPPWYDDEGIYAAVAHAMLRGEALYQTILDNRPPGLYWLYALFLAASGYSVFGIKLAATAFVLFTQTTVFYIGWRIAGRRAGLLAAGLLGFLSSLPLLEGNTANAEIFMMFPTALGVLLLLWGRPFWAGVALGSSVLIKQIAGVEFLASLIALALFYPRPFRSIALLSVGCALPIAATALYLLAQASLDEFAFTGIAYYLGYVQRDGRIPKEYWIFKLGLLAITCGVIWRHYRGTRNEASFHQPFLALWTVFALYGALFTSRPYPHYLLQSLPPLLLWLTSTLVPNWNRSLERPTGGKMATTAGLALVACWLFSAVYIPWPAWARPERAVDYYNNWAQYVSGRRSTAEYNDFFDKRVNRNFQLARYLKEKARPGDYLLIWGEEPWLYPITRLGVAPPYTVSYYAYEMPQGLQRVVEAIRQRRPSYIIWTTNKPLFPALKAVLEQEYTQVSLAQNAALLQRKPPTNTMSATLQGAEGSRSLRP